MEPPYFASIESKFKLVLSVCLLVGHRLLEGLSNSDQYQYQHKNVRIQRSPAQGKPQTCTDQQLDQQKSQFLLITEMAWK